MNEHPVGTGADVDGAGLTDAAPADRGYESYFGSRMGSLSLGVLSAVWGTAGERP